MPKELARRVGLFCLVDPTELSGLDEWAEWLLALGGNLCDVVERDGDLVLLETRQRVGEIDHRLRVEIYADEHAPPHFHVKSDSISASFRIDDCSLLRGNVSSGALRKIRYWHQHAKPMLVDTWNATRPGDCTVGECKHA